MEKILYNLVFNRKKELSTKGTALVQVEAYQNRRKKYFSTKVYLKPEQWDAKRGLVKNHPNARALNQLLYAYMAEIEEKELWIWQQGKTVTLEALKDAVCLSKEKINSFLSFYQEEVATSPLKESTKVNHLSTLDLLKEFKKDMTFSDLTFDLISSFDSFLQSKGYHVNTIAKHMKHLKRYTNVAINKDLIDIQRYAFRKYKIKSIDSRHSHLSIDELECLEKLSLEGKHARLYQTLDAFLFCCYVGLRYSDFTHLTPENLIEIDRNQWLVLKSIKTRIEVRLPIYLLFDGKGVKILNKYRDNLPGFFNLRDNSNINKELLLIAKAAGINKRISFHTARHTNATLLIYSGVNITTVQKLLGHKSVKTTQVYTNIMDTTIVRDLALHALPQNNGRASKRMRQ